MVLSNHMLSIALTFSSSLQIFLRCIQTSLSFVFIITQNFSPANLVLDPQASILAVVLSFALHFHGLEL